LIRRVDAEQTSWHVGKANRETPRKAANTLNPNLEDVWRERRNERGEKEREI